MPHLLNENSVPLRVLREHFGMPREADARAVFEAVAKEKGVLFTVFLDECTIFEEDGVLPQFVADFCDEVLGMERERMRGSNGD